MIPAAYITPFGGHVYLQPSPRSLAKAVRLIGLKDTPEPTPQTNVFDEGVGEARFSIPGPNAEAGAPRAHICKKRLVSIDIAFVLIDFQYFNDDSGNRLRPSRESHACQRIFVCGSANIDL